MQAHKSNRQVLHTTKLDDTPGFRSTTETPFTLAMSLYCYHHLRSNKLANVLSKAGVGVSYERVKQCTAQVAEGVQRNMRENGRNYVPPGLHRGKKLRFSVDNIDTQVDTTDGKDSFHATAMTVYQREPTLDSQSSVQKVSSSPGQELIDDVFSSNTSSVLLVVKRQPR